MQPEARIPLSDFLQTCRRISRFIENRTLNDYERDDLLRSAVERQLSIAGEMRRASMRSYSASQTQPDSVSTDEAMFTV
jgi:uncharacterized protein with HEPN domain